MSCDFKPGDDVEFIIPYVQEDFASPSFAAPSGVFVCLQVGSDPDDLCWSCGTSYWIELSGEGGMTCPCTVRKVHRRNEGLTIEAFSVIKDGGFEEPKRTPSKEKAKEKAQ